MTPRRKVAVVLVDRANYGRMQPVMKAIQARPELELLVVCGGTLLLERFGKGIENIKADGFEIAAQIYVELEGSNPVTMTKSLGYAVGEFATAFQHLKPDIVLVIGDRYEALGATLAASYMNLCLVHIQGGEVSGSIDESARHCMTKLSHYHFPSTAQSADYIMRMGERPDAVFHVGCPSGDIIHRMDRALPDDFLSNVGVGAKINPNQPFLMVTYHPVTTHYEQARVEAEQLMQALARLRMPTLWLWPNIDAGSDGVSKTIRLHREHDPDVDNWLQMVKNFTPETYLKLLANAACAVGNSSSFLRDASFLGTPVVLTGDRQNLRETAEHVTKVPLDPEIMVTAIEAQLAHGPYPASTLYGDGQASERIAEHLCHVDLYAQKYLYYAEREAYERDKHREPV